MNILHLLLVLCNTLILVAGQFLWKIGMERQTDAFASVFSVVKLFFSPFIFTGLAMYGLATVLWLFILTKIPLSVAYPLQSSAYIIAVFGAFFLFNESITPWKIAGVCFIMLGVSMIGLSEMR
ncbi:EamA family transporter [Indiicoccus explosivorum]|uniref:EamA family transporter n=1 Tax=Indiicoccus explosivorum TaxID=1917864 RepID=UPI000B43CE5F|nr:EamA family transporter [Indiicoccus explosivorum]